jgi:general secretion pathway protein K
MVKPHKANRGIALLATMLAVALMTLLVMDFTTSSALGYRSAANQAGELRAYYFARSGVNVGLGILEQNATANPPQPGNGTTPPSVHDSLDQVWARPYPPIPLDGGRVSVAIVDEDRKIPINLLYNVRTRQPDPLWAPIVERLLANLNLSPDLLPVMIDWIDPDSIESAGGAEADFYLRLMPQYEPRNGPIPTNYDLRMLKGIDDRGFFALARCLTAMPVTSINANTAPAEVLAALAPELENDPSLVKEIIAARAEDPFAQPTDLANRIPDVGKITSLSRLLTTHSKYFTISGEGDFAGARKRVYATFVSGPAPNSSAATFTLANWHED